MIIEKKRNWRNPCASCERNIGKSEQVFSTSAGVVCVDCHADLDAQAKVAAAKGKGRDRVNRKRQR